MRQPRRRPERPAPDLGAMPDAVRDALHGLITRNRRDMRTRGATLFGDEWLDGFLEGLFVAGALASHDHVNAVRRAIRRDLLDTLAE